MRQLQQEARESRQRAEEVKAAPSPAEPEICTHGISMDAMCFGCARWGTQAVPMEVWP